MMMVVVTVSQCVCMISTTEACWRHIKIPVSSMDEHISPSSNYMIAR